MSADTTPSFGAIIIGDEILSGRREDKHFAKLLELLKARGLRLASVRYVADEPPRLVQALKESFAGADIVFSFGGIGATPDDHTRQCAAAALGVELELHPEAKALIEERMRDVAREQGKTWEPERSDNLHRLNMGVFPRGATIIPNPYNKIPGFSCTGMGQSAVHFVPGFPVMAWPMIESVLEQHYPHLFARQQRREQSVIVFGAIEAALTPLMEQIEAAHPEVKVFSLPSVDHAEWGRHVELGVKGPVAAAEAAYADLLAGLRATDAPLGPELVRG